MLWGGLAVIGVARLAGVPAITQMAVVAGLLVVCSLNQPYWAALEVAVVAWLLVTGFVVNQYGDLHLSGKRDLLRLSILLLLAIAAAGWRGRTRVVIDHDDRVREGQAWNR
jgi:phosphatidylserine synthase